jgi:hypothetical protein
MRCVVIVSSIILKSGGLPAGLIIKKTMGGYCIVTCYKNVTTFALLPTFAMLSTIRTVINLI